MGVEVFGVDEWKQEATRVLQEYPEKGAEFIDAQAKKLSATIKKRTVKGPTGKLKRSWRKTKPKVKYGAITGEVKSSSPHAHLYEYGHKIKNRKEGPVLGFVPGRFAFQTSFNELDAGWDGDMKAWFEGLVKELEV